jgi:hypothetical protein
MWVEALRFDPFPLLLHSNNEAIKYFVQQDLLDEKSAIVETLWQSPDAQNIISKQLPSGSWVYNGGKSHVRSGENYNQLETFRVLGQLVELYGFTKKHPAVRNAADYLFGFQTEEGDFRGIYANQYTPNYTAAIAELLTKAGYANDGRINKVFTWLISIRQDDGGWAIPFRTVSDKNRGSSTLMQALANSVPLEPDKSKPFSHCITGVVLRAFAAHPEYRSTYEAKLAGELLESRFLKADRYPDRKAASFWIRFTFPFWFTDLLSALDSLSLIGSGNEDTEIQTALKWFRERQGENGLWKLTLLKSKSIKDMQLWINLAICRVFKRFY